MNDSDMIQRAIPYIKNQNQIQFNYRDYDTEHDSKHYVMWSGGCDSTLLLYEVLETYGVENVVAVSYNYPWLLQEKAKSEEMHRDAFKAKLKTLNKTYAEKPINQIEFRIDMKAVSGDFPGLHYSGLPQAVAWLLSVPICAKDDSYIYTGAIRSDDLTLCLESYHEMFRGISKTLSRKIYLREPYLYLNKANVIEKLIRYGIYDSTWHCEVPDDVNTPCYECVPCKTHIRALTELSFGPKDDIVTITAKLELEKIRQAQEQRQEKASESSECITNDSNETEL